MLSNDRQHRYLLRINRRCLRCGDLPLKIWLEKMVEMEENTAEVKRVTCRKIDYT